MKEQKWLHEKYVWHMDIQQKASLYDKNEIARLAWIPDYCYAN